MKFIKTYLSEIAFNYYGFRARRCLHKMNNANSERERRYWGKRFDQWFDKFNRLVEKIIREEL